MSEFARQINSDPAWLGQQLRTSLPAAHRALLDATSAQAAALDLQLYLVGGMVRDLLLQRANSDLDFAVEGDAQAVATAVAVSLTPAAKVIRHPQFGTAALEWQPGLGQPPAEADYATTRRETYAQPAALPTVSFASLADDLARRDFTINAFALRLPDLTLIDLHGGLADLRAGLLRVLHAGSFVDDPTRIFRAVRYAVRLDFGLAAETLADLQAAVAGGMIARLSPDRLRHELAKVLHEPTASAMLLRLNDLGVLTAIHPGLALSLNSRAALVRLAVLGGDELAYYAAICVDLLAADPAQVGEVAARLNLPPGTRADLHALGLLRASVPGLELLACTTPQPRSTVYWALQGYSSAALRAYALLSPEHETVTLYLNDLSKSKLLLTGDDLARLGLPPGPAYKPIQRELLRAQLDGEIVSRVQAELLASKLIGAQVDR